MTPDCRAIRRHILEVAKLSGQGHIPTCFSVVEMIWAAYAAMRHDPHAPGRPDRDLFILSKGHAALAHYSVLARLGYFPPDEVYGLGAKGSRFGCHADRTKVPGVEVSTGSLGHGIGVAVGMALAARIDRTDRRVFVLVGDGEANEGSVWEALMVAAHNQLSNLAVLYDDNRSHARGLQIENPAEKLAAFGCEVVEADGHDCDALVRALGSAPAGAPLAVVARTRKGWGSPTLIEQVHEWHRRSPNDEEMARLLEELDAWAV
jgi:transketolase